MRQVLCVWFPNWPIQRVSVARPELRGRAVVLHSPLDSRSPSVTACSSPAARRGVRIGMPLAEARTLVSTGRFVVDDPAADEDSLRRLAWTCQRFTPRAGLEEADRPENLFLDVTGCELHFGGIQQLCEQAAESFHSLGYSVRIAVAPTFGAAWAVVRTMKGRSCIVPEREDLPQTLSPLPLWGLRLPPDMLTLLAECGLRTIGQVQQLPRSSLPSRFGPELLQRLDQALGTSEELLQLELPPEPIQAQSAYEFPLENVGDVSAALQSLLDRVLDELRHRQQETQHLHVSWKTDDKQTDGFDIRLLRPTTAVERFTELLALHLERQRFTGGIAVLQMEATPCRLRSVQRRTLFDHDQRGEAEFFHLIERLSSRLGPQAVVRARLRPEAQPERAVVVEPWLDDAQGISPGREEDGPAAKRRLHRPLRLLASPVSVPTITDEVTGLPRRFYWRFRDHVVACCEGPERIETGWWRAPMIRRDYYRVETTAGGRFWLFRELARGTWFLQGVFE